MSKSSLYHDRDGEAIDALRRILPTYWLYKDPANKFGGKEYSEDLIIEIVNNDAKRTVTSIEFGVQNKTDIDIRKRHVTVKLEVNDVKRLIGLQRPVLIHGFDVNTQTSYWLWLNEWYPHHVSKLKRKTGKVSIKIPKTNMLNATAVEKIAKYARWVHIKNKIRETGDMIAHVHPRDYNVQVITGDHQITTIINPKHDGAIPTVHALDEIASNAMIQAIETGLPVPLIGKFTIANIPELAIDGTEFTLEAAWLIPSEGQKSILKIELLDDTGAVIFKSPFVEIRNVQPGTVVSRWEGTDEERQVSYTFTFDVRADTSSFSCHFHTPPWNASALHDYFAKLDDISRTDRIRLTNLRTEQTAERACPPAFVRQLTLEEVACRRLAEALLMIESKLNVRIPMPEQFDGAVLGRAEWIAEIFRDGAVKINADDLMPEGTVLICGDPAKVARKNLEHFSENGALSIVLDRSRAELRIPLLDHELNLGMAKYACQNVTIINIEELRDTFDKHDLTDDTSVRMVFDIDRDEVYLVFENWSPILQNNLT